MHSSACALSRRFATAFSTLCLLSAVCAQTDPAITSWKVNRTGLTGNSPVASIHATVSLIQADVTRVRYTATNAYINSNGVPSHPIGPWANNPNSTTSQNRLLRIPRAPVVQTGTRTATPLGPVGVLLNGVAIFNAKDGRSYNNLNVWNQNAYVVEGPSMDSAPGHPAPGGTYHYHMRPVLPSEQLCEDSHQHSPLIGFAFDGFPIYGAYGYSNSNGTGGVRHLQSGYRLRNITLRTTLPNGTILLPSQYGPPVSTTRPLGYYLEDFEYVLGYGDLDAFNGRFSITPEYPAGTYAYWATIDNQGAPAYPFLLGPQYYGVVATDNLNRTVTVPANAVDYSGGGAFCRGTGCGSLSLAFSGAPAVGSSFAANLYGSTSLASGFLLFGYVASAPYPLNLSSYGATGCQLYQSADVLLPLAFSAGSATSTLSFPAIPALAGLIAYVQGAAFEPAANPLGLSTSRGSQLILRP